MALAKLDDVSLEGVIPGDIELSGKGNKRVSLLQRMNNLQFALKRK